MSYNFMCECSLTLCIAGSLVTFTIFRFHGIGEGCCEAIMLESPNSVMSVKRVVRKRHDSV